MAYSIIIDLVLTKRNQPYLPISHEQYQDHSVTAAYDRHDGTAGTGSSCTWQQ